MGLRHARGESLQRMIAVLGAVAFLVQGYNQAMMNGFMTLPSFLETVPEVDTTHTTGSQKSHNSTIQGESIIPIEDIKIEELIQFKVL